MKQKTLLVNHILPPTSGVGGRRWTLISKFLIKKDIQIEALTSKVKSNEVSPWLDDIKINKSYYQNFYPSILSQNCNSFFKKLNYRISLMFLKLVCKGNYFDRAVLIKYFFLKKLKNQYENYKFSNLIVSGAPFNLLYYSALFKEKNKNINLISDFRDPWTWSDNYGIRTISKKRFEIEKQKETKVIEISNFVIVPTEKMKIELGLMYPKYLEKIIVLPHGYDEENIIPIRKNIEPNKKLNFLYVGELYNNFDEFFLKIERFINLNKGFSLNIYSHTRNLKKLQNIIHDSNSNFNFNGQYQYRDFTQIIKQNDFIILYCPKQNKDYIMTKILEFAYSKLPIIFFSDHGIASNFIESNNFGFHSPHNFDYIELRDKIHNYLEQKYSFYDQNHILEQYSMTNIASQVFDLLN